MTLMEYFKINNSKHALQEIDEESNSEVSGGTPCFADPKDNAIVFPKSKKHRREKMRT